MEVVKRQRELLVGSVATLFDEWEYQLQQNIKECDRLKGEIETYRSALRVKDDAFTQLKNENECLKEEVSKVQAISGVDDSARIKALVEEYNALYKEHELQKANAAANQHDLIKQLRREREKLRSWNRFSSPGPRSAPWPASDAIQKQANPTHGWKAPNNLPEGGEHTVVFSSAQETVSYWQNGSSAAQPGHTLDISNHGERRHGVHGDTDIVQERDKLLSGSTQSEQPRKATELESSFVDAHLLCEPRCASPELPLMPENSLGALIGGRTLSTDTEKAVKQDSLPQIRHSDSTAPPSDEPELINVAETSPDDAPSSDAPEFLGARHVKNNAIRKVLPSSEPAAGSPDEPVTIKSDPDTSFATSKPPQLVRFTSSIHESLDPLTSRPEQKSPRKQRPPPLTTSHSSEKALRQGLAEARGLTSQRAISEPRCANEIGLSLIQTPSDRRRNYGKVEQATPLRQIDANTQIGRRNLETSSDSKSRKRKHDDGREVEAIPTISEDGEEFTTKARKISKERTYSTHSANASVHQRLGSLLTEPSGQKCILMPISQRDIDAMTECLWADSLCCTLSGERHHHALMKARNKDWDWWDEAKNLLDSKLARTPSIPFWHPSKVRQRKTLNAQASTPKPKAATNALTSRSTSKPTATPSRPPAPEATSHTPYRSLPLSSLNLTHFKLNPSANHNLSYAYSDVVRNQSERKCLPGCTRPECCGRKFAALAQTLPPPHTNNNQSANSSSTIPTSPSSLTPDDHTLLQSHLGTPHYTALLTHNPEHLLPHLLPARTAHLANKYGKAHRGTHHRPPSPPGFWNVDFPGTPEREEHRRVAEEREREEVERRWRESLKNEVGGKGGDTRRAGEGLWMFADE